MQIKYFFRIIETDTQSVVNIMKSRIIKTTLMVGLACLAIAIVFLTRMLFNMPVKNVMPITVPGPDVSSQPAILSSSIEVGNDSDTGTVKSRNPVKVSRYSTGSDMPTRKVPLTNDSLGKVVFLAGSASVVRRNGSTTLLSMNSDILRMDRIETGPASKLEIRFTDGTVVSQGEKSILVIEDCLYSPDESAQCNFVMRFSRGICRVVTGLIAEINPDRFKVRAKMATVGIRGCDLVFRSTPAINDVYVLDLGKAKSIEILSTANGSGVNNLDTGSEIDIDKSLKREIAVTDPLSLVSITEGKGPEQRTIGIEEARSLITETSRMTPARYELQQKSDGAILKIKPVKLPSDTAERSP